MPGRTGRYEKFWSQFETVKAAWDDNLNVWPPTAYDDWDIAPQFVYEDGWVLMDEVVYADSSVHSNLGTERVDSTDDGPVRRAKVRDSMIDVMGRLTAFDGAATPNHLVSICDDVNMCPADEPFPLPANAALWPPKDPEGGGMGVKIRVVDTGIVSTFATAQLDGESKQVVDSVSGLIKIYAGHGTYIAHLINCVAPGAHVFVTNALARAGTALELDLGNALCEALAAHPDIISLSAGTSTHNRRELLGLRRFWAELQHDEHTLLVAAAGNEGTVQALMPAALGPCSGGAILSVGALRADHGGLACFSNWGPEVQVYAPGERLVNVFPEGDYRYADAPVLRCRYHDPSLYCPCTCVTAPPEQAMVRFVPNGRARWSGTSFATPIVAGLVASYMSRSKLTPREAARRLLQDNGFTFDLPSANPTLPRRTGLALVPASMHLGTRAS